MKRPVLYFFSFIFLFAFVNNANAQWVSDSVLNTKVRDTTGLEGAVTEIVTAPNGNSYISWAEYATTGYEMRMQLVDSNGYNLWGAHGILLDSLIGSTLYRYDMELDDSGNAVIAFQDMSSGVNWPIAFKVNQQGNMLWGANGIQLTDGSAASGLSPVIGFTDSNNVIIAWSASPASGKTFVSFQKFSPTGSMLWSSQIIDGTNTANYERPWIVRTSGEQFIMQYVHRSGSGLGVSTMYAQEYDNQANPLWANPVNISTKTIGFAAFPEPIPDGYGGFFLTFTSSNPTSASISEVYAQRVYSNGNIWNSTGVELGTGSTLQRFDDGQVYVASQNKYYASISVTDASQDHSGVGLQGIDTAGNLLFPSNPQMLVPLSTNSNINQGIIYVTGIKSIDTGLIVLYESGTTPYPVIIKAVEANYAGGYGWADTSTIVSAANSDKLKYGMGQYEHGQVVVTWIDERLSNGGVYAQNILGSGKLGSHTCATIVVSPSSVSDTAGSVYNTTLSQTGGVGTVTYSVTAGNLPSGITLGSTGILSGTADTSGTYIFTITATDGNGCSSSQADTIIVSCPVVSLSALAAVCDTSAAFTLTGGMPAGGTYTGTGVSGGMFHPVSAGSGTFTIKYLYSVGNCADSATQSIVVNNCGEGVKNITKELLAECMPNPSNGLVTIKMDEQVYGNVSVRIMDMEGRVILNNNGVAVNGAYSQTFDMTQYPKGIYLVQLSTANGIANMKIELQ